MGSEFYDVPALCCFVMEYWENWPPPLNAAPDVSQAVSIGLWKYSLAEMENSLSLTKINQNNEFMSRS